MGAVLGVDEKFYPMEADGGAIVVGPGLKAVLVQGEIGDYACYVGFGNADFVAQHGDKISFEEACVHFPGGQLKRKKYRD